MKTVKNLLLAMLNATLILVALCLFLLWQLSGSVERVSTGFAENLTSLAPAQARISALTDEVAALRGDLATLRAEGAVADKLSEIELKTERLQGILDGVATTPEQLMQASIQQAAESATDLIFGLRGCEPPET